MAEKKPFVDCGTLFDAADAFAHSPEMDQLFDAAMTEALLWHRLNCPDFSAFLDYKKFCPGVRPIPAESIPPFLVTIFKEHRLISIPEDKVKIELTSSGTGGQRSAIVLDNRSYKRILKIVDGVFGSLGLVQRDTKANYIAFTYDPKVAGSVGTAFSDKILTGLTKRGSVFYAIKWDDARQTFAFDLQATVKKLLTFAKGAPPVRILGFPAYLWEVCQELVRQDRRLELGENAFIITGGGWKIHKDREIPKDDFKAEVAAVLGLPAANIRDTFGMVEHGIPYVDCECSRLHVPVYARARVVDPETLQALPTGTPGLLHLMTPYLTSYPSISLLTTDRAVIETDCPCGRPGNTLRILGRAGLAKHKGCAITALEYLSHA